ncbi:MAG: hypothetical protein WAU24_06240, partial [Chitinophagaceae bacterium]
KPAGSPITTNLGITSITTTYLEDVNNYMAARFTVFARALYTGIAGSLGGISKFYDCEDNRHGCTTGADHDTCTTPNCL